MIDDDGDSVRGLGFVTMYSAIAEEDVDDVLRVMHLVEPFDEAKLRWPISRKLKHAVNIVRRLPGTELQQLAEAIEFALGLFERRNEVVHGRIYAGFDRVDYLQSGRPSVPTRPIDSAELYQLANDFWEYRGALIGPQLYRLPRAVAAFTNGTS
jgi:hypothetical protein